MLEIHEIDPGNVLVPPRQRGTFDHSYIADLSENIKAIGQLQPGVCRLDEDENVSLIIGECRLRACKQAGVNFRYYLKEDITDPAMLYECELMENLLRRPLTWKEEVDAKAKLHELRQNQRGTPRSGVRGGHTIEDTANELHESKGLVSEDIKLAAYADAIPEIANAATKAEAKKILKRIEKEVERDQLLKAAVKKSQTTETTTADASSNLTEMEQRLLEYDSRVLLGDFDEIEVEGPFDVCLFDPPWGVEFDAVSSDNASQIKYEDKQESFLTTFPERIRKLYDLMAENSHIYVFFGIVHHKFVYDTLEAAGFKTNRIPLIWHKQGSHRTRNPTIWPGRSYEPIAFARKGTKELERQGAPDVITTPQPTPKIKQIHPSGKHPAIYKELLLRSAKPGDRVLDPMAGSCMAGVAADFLKPDLALEWLMIERDDSFRTLGIFNLNKGYYGIIDDVEGTDPDQIAANSSEDFTNLTPGSKEWVNFWRMHPDKQSEMIAFRSKQGAYNGGNS